MPEPEQFGGKGREKSSYELFQEQKYQEFRAAQNEEERIMGEIDNVLTSTPDRAEAEKSILEKYAPLMDEAMKKTSEALKTWLDVMKAAREREELEMEG